MRVAGSGDPAFVVMLAPVVESGETAIPEQSRMVCAMSRSRPPELYQQDIASQPIQ
jgi:hypothetical protein